MISRPSGSVFTGYVLRKTGRLSDLALLFVSSNGHERRVEMPEALTGLEVGEN